jgi:hypothetical protein
MNKGCNGQGLSGDVGSWRAQRLAATAKCVQQDYHRFEETSRCRIDGLILMKTRQATMVLLPRANLEHGLHEDIDPLKEQIPKHSFCTALVSHPCPVRLGLPTYGSLSYWDLNYKAR